MTDEELKIARAFVACGRWEWLSGMLTDSGYRLVRRERGVMSGMWRITQHAPERHLDCVNVARHGFIPDITDPCTRGGILQVARDATGDPGLHLRCIHPYTPSYTAAPPYTVYSGRGQRLSDRHDSEAESLLQVLQAAPEVKS